MIISQNSAPPLGDFQKLIVRADELIRNEAKLQPSYFMELDATKFEVVTFDSFRTASMGSPFEGSIELISGHKFPDIVIHKYYGVEVKTTKQAQWKSTGNSVFETTRVDDVEKIFIYFARLSNPIDFKFRRYQDCLYDIAVTHSPRYLIDMELASGSSIFDKMDIEYNDLRHLENPVKKFIEYFRKSVKPGEEPWWMSSEDETLVRPIVRLFSNLDVEDKSRLIIESMVLFPEVFGSAPTKYQRVATWLAARHGIVDSSLRDRFTAGGKVDIDIGSKTYRDIPRVFKNLQESIKEVLALIADIPDSELRYYWPDYNSDEARLDQWIKLFLKFSSQTIPDERRFLIHLLGYNHRGEKSTFLKEEEKKYGLA